VLLALAEGDAHGWAIIRRIRELEGTTRTPSSGSLYIAMLRLEEHRSVEETTAPEGIEGDDARRRYYRLTAFGRRVLAAEMDRLARLVKRARERNVVPRPVRGHA